jgi:hypothetical protein
LADQCAGNPQLLCDAIKMKTGHLKKVEQARALGHEQRARL